MRKYTGYELEMEPNININYFTYLVKGFSSVIFVLSLEKDFGQTIIRYDEPWSTGVLLKRRTDADTDENT